MATKSTLDVNDAAVKFVETLALRVDNPNKGYGDCQFTLYGHTIEIDIEADEYPTDDQMGTWWTTVQVDGEEIDSYYESDIPSTVTDDWKDFLEEIGVSIDESRGFEKVYMSVAGKTKNYKKIKDSSVSNMLYGATLEEYEKAGTVDTGGLGFDYYEFTPEGLAKIAMDQFRDALAAPRLPKKVYQWEQEHNMEEEALNFLKSIGMPDAEYTYCGGVVIYFDDNYDYDDDEGLKYKILFN